MNSYSLNNDDIIKSDWIIKNSLSNIQSFSKCGIFNLMGGFQICGINSTLEKQYINLTAHFRSRITFFFMKIDEWNMNNVTIYIDSQKKYTLQINGFDDQNELLCGLDQYPEAIRPIDVIFDHTSSNMTIQITTDLSTNSSFWGIFNFSFSIEICHISCKSCNSYNSNDCISCPIGSYLDFDNSCRLCNNITCPIKGDEQQYFLNFSCVDQCPNHYYLGNNTCQEFDISCKTCNQASFKNCLTCENPLFLYEGACVLDCPNYFYKNYEDQSCSLCHHSCETCLNSSASSCTSCDNKTRQMNNYTNTSENSSIVGYCSCISSYYDDSNSHFCFGFLHYIYILIN